MNRCKGENRGKSRGSECGAQRLIVARAYEIDETYQRECGNNRHSQQHGEARGLRAVKAQKQPGRNGDTGAAGARN